MKPFLTQPNTHVVDFHNWEPKEELIRERAYLLWVARGQPLDDSATKDWYEALHQLRGE